MSSNLLRFVADQGILSPGKEIVVGLSGIDHVQLAIPPGKESDAREFYGNILGLTEKPKPPELAVRGGAWFENDYVKIHLGIDHSFRSAKKAHPGLLVRDLKAFIVHLRHSGVEVIDDDLDTYHRVYISDPFGNRIELIDAK